MKLFLMSSVEDFKGMCGKLQKGDISYHPGFTFDQRGRIRTFTDRREIHL